ncbi:MAG TPA: hypothetical protein VG432_00080 [Gemmatimonadaceae bacterium]|nr:hypothetical protein [Gemmatimonadaceae bacterium]
MRHLLHALPVALVVGWSAPLPAQQADWVSQLLTAARLPVATAEARREGVASTDIRAVLDAMIRAKLPASEATLVIDTARVLQREQGPVNNFGAFVQSQLAAGKRGPALAAAIRAEHARQGKGNAAKGAKNRERDDAEDDHERGNDSKRGDDSKRDDDSAKGHGRGNPGSQGKPEGGNPKHDNGGRGHSASGAR